MKQDWTSLEPFRERRGDFGTNPGDHFGLFCIGLNGEDVAALCMASDGLDPDVPEELRNWEHVSVSIRERSRIYLPGKGSLRQRIPEWNEMHAIKKLFWDDEECVVQYHPPQSQYVNTCEFCLHLWRKVGYEFPLPPKILVG